MLPHTVSIESGEDAGGAAGHFEADMYARVFLSSAHAMQWYHPWNDDKGDPAQPFHYFYLVESIQQQVCRWVQLCMCAVAHA